MNNLVLYPDAPKTLNKVLESYPQEDNDAIFGKNCVFKIENYGNVKMMFLNFTITPNGATTFALPTSPFIIENVFLECNGIPFARINTTYCVSRYESLSGSGLYEQIKTAANISGTFNSAQTISLPLFFYVIDGQVFNPSLIKNLTVRCITKRTKEAMGFDIDPLSISITLTTIYEQGITKDGAMISCPPLRNSYNIATDTFSIIGGTTSKVVQLNNQSKVKNLIFMIRKDSNASTIGVISSVKLRMTNGSESTFSNLSNFSFGNTFGSNDGTVFKIAFDSFIKLNGNMNPLIATVSYTAASDSTLFVVYEYESTIIEENGMVLEHFDQSLF